MLALSGCARPEAKKARFIAQGKKFLEAKDYTRAILAFKNAAAAVPGDAETQYQLGAAYMASGDLRDATGSFRRATELNPAHAAAQIMLAQQLARSGNTQLVEDARERVKNVLSSSPENVGAVQALAFTEFRLGRPEEAERQLRQALSRFPRSLTSAVSLADLLLSRKDLSGAESVLKGAVAQAPDSADALVALAAFYAMTGRLGAAEDHAVRALKVDANNGSALVVLAGIQLTSGRRDEAESNFRRASALPEFKAVYAIYLLQNGKTSQGIAELEKLVAADPADVGLHRREKRTGNTADARIAFAAAIALNPKFRPAYLMLVHLDMKDGKPAAAREELLRILAIYEIDAEAHHLLAGIEYEAGDVASALPHYKKAVDLDPSNVDALNDLAYVLLLSGHTDEAMTYAQAAQEKAPENGAVLDTLGWALYSKGSYKRAVEHLQQAVAKGGGALPRYHLAMAYVKVGDLDLGEETLDKALRIDPKIPEASMARQLIAESVRPK
jgi:Tfp pilus assembly protein PilF